MLNAIKRTWIPKNAAPQSPQASKDNTPVPTDAPSIYAGLCMFDDLPTPQAQEVSSDSIWAVFEDVQPMSARA